MHNEEINQGIIEASSKQIQEKYKKNKTGEEEMEIDKQG